MITVAIYINDVPIYTRSAVRISSKNYPFYMYKDDTGKIIEHDYTKGAIPLAKALLDSIEEVKEDDFIR